MEHINVLELQAAYFALKSLCGQESELNIQIQLDNSTAVAYINNMGGTKSLKLNNLALEIWEWCYYITFGYQLCTLCTGKTNVEADKQSRQFSDQHEWMLDKKQFQAIQNRYPLLEIDLFASCLNAQLPNYVAWQPDPECVAVNAFTISWKCKMFYAFPPFSLIPRCVQKIQHPTKKEPHPMHKSLRLMVCPDCHMFGTHPFVTRFMKGVYEKLKPQPKYTQICDVSLVLRYLATLTPNSSLSLKNLTLKLVMLLLLVSSQRPGSGYT
jgi:hypothetical protein